MNAAAARRFLRRESGAAAIEFALIAPFVLIILVGLVNVGLQMRQAAKLNQATREVAEAAMFTSVTSVLSAMLTKSLSDHGLTPSSTPRITLVCICPGETDKPNCTTAEAANCTSTGLPWGIVIEISAETLYTPLFGGSARTLTSQARVQIR